MHPHHSSAYNDDFQQQLYEALQNNKSVAVGECGLDFYYMRSPRQMQLTAFERQIQLAISINKPIVIHSRNAELETIEIINRCIPTDWPVHVHCFTSSLQMAQQLLQSHSNLCLGFTGVVTFPSAVDVCQVVDQVPIDRMLLETDGPYMAPVPFRGKICHPGLAPYTAIKLAQIKQVSLAEMLTATQQNAIRTYRLPQ